LNDLERHRRGLCRHRGSVFQHRHHHCAQRGGVSLANVNLYAELIPMAQLKLADASSRESIPSIDLNIYILKRKI
jgi:hypothetical protein